MCQPQVHLLGVRIDNLDRQQVLAAIKEFVVSNRPHQIITANAELVYRAWHDPEAARVIAEAALVTPDGAGVVWAARRLEGVTLQRVTGIDLTADICEAAVREGWRLFLFGGRPGVAEEAATRLEARYPGLAVCGTAHGYLEPAEGKKLVTRIRTASPQVLLVGLGAPKQEFWVSQYLEELGVPVCLGVGGSLDVLAGRAQRAPGWIQRANLEWLYRLLRQPSRLRRQMALPAFAWRVWWAGRRRV
ncbi:MAG: glycosyltransferase [Clostridia bacterium]|nr:MAG: glycosyltransferase [Clostridia bacterium]